MSYVELRQNDSLVNLIRAKLDMTHILLLVVLLQYSLET